MTSRTAPCCRRSSQAKAVLMVLVAAVVGVPFIIAAAAAPAPAMDYIEGPYGAVEFDHEAHTLMSSGCADCHHTHGSENTRCMGCHEIAPEGFKSSLKDSFMGCANCHGEIDPESPEVPPLKVALHNTCFKCHKDMGSIGQSPAGCTEQCHSPVNENVEGQ